MGITQQTDETVAQTKFAFLAVTGIYITFECENALSRHTSTAGRKPAKKQHSEAGAEFCLQTNSSLGPYLQDPWHRQDQKRPDESGSCCQ